MGRGRKQRKQAEAPEGTDGPIYREVDGPAEAGEMLATFKAAADADEAAQRLKDELAKLKESASEARSVAEAAIRSALHLARTGRTLIRVEVVEVIDEQAGIVRLNRKDTGEEVDRRALTAGELQALAASKPGVVSPEGLAKLFPHTGPLDNAYDFNEDEVAAAQA